MSYINRLLVTNYLLIIDGILFRRRSCKFGIQQMHIFFHMPLDKNFKDVLIPELDAFILGSKYEIIFGRGL